jgi:hypothetical protein
MTQTLKHRFQNGLRNIFFVTISIYASFYGLSQFEQDTLKIDTNQVFLENGVALKTPKSVFNNVLKIDLSLPIHLRGTGIETYWFPPDNEAFFNDSYKYSFAFGLGYERQIQRETFFRIGLSYGIVRAYRMEAYGPYFLTGNQLGISRFIQEAKLNQIQVNSGFSKLLNITKTFSIQLGIDLTFTMAIRDSYTNYIRREASEIGSTNTFWAREDYLHREIKSINAFGISPIIEPQFSFGKNWIASIQLKLYLLFQRNQLTTNDQWGYTIVSGNGSQNMFFEEIQGQTDGQITQKSLYLTPFIPVISIKYRF